MLIGVPKEIKNHENRVGLNPQSVRSLTQKGHQVLVEAKAGQGIGASDADYLNAGANVVFTPDQVFAEADMIVKVKEPQPSEWVMFRPNQTLFTYLHLAPDPDQAKGLVDSGCTAIAYETVTDADGRLPLLTPMSEVAGCMAPQMAAFYGQKHFGGHGKLACGVTGVDAAHVVVIGGGVSGYNAAKVAAGMGAHVTVLERSPQHIKRLQSLFGEQVDVIESTAGTVEGYAMRADILIGAVLVPGAAAPKLVSADMIRRMQAGTVVVDIAVDQGGCFETTRPTTHRDPIYVVDDVVHYCVANMPGAYPQTSTAALNNATLPYIQTIADKGVEEALRDDVHLHDGLNVKDGKITNKAVAQDLNMTYNPSGFHGSSDS